MNEYHARLGHIIYYMSTSLGRTYYGPGGIGYSLTRINMGGCDFSWRTYTYLPEDPAPLDAFSLQPEDTEYKVGAIEG